MEEKRVVNINDLISKISVDSEFKITPPKDLLSDEDYIVIKDAYDIVGKYKNNTWMSEISESELQSDIIYLQCTLVILAEKVSTISSHQDSEEDKIKTARAKVRLLLKQLKQEAESSSSLVKITLEDIKDASLALTEELANNYDNIKVGANFIKFVFYSIKDLVQYLDRALHRMFSFIPQKIAGQEYNARNGTTAFSVHSGSQNTRWED